MDPGGGSSILRFGGEIELDASAWQLRRAGRPQKLERIPMEILLLLAQQPGKLVSREQIVERIWGKEGAYLDTDNSINGAVRKIRQALGDTSEEPRFIQTVMGLGYRFVAAADTASEAQGTIDRRRSGRRSTDADPAGNVPRLQASPASPPESAPAATDERKTRRLWWSAAGLLLALCASLAWLLRSSGTVGNTRPPLGSMLAVLPLTNLTGDPAQEYFSDGLTEELIAQIGNADPKRLSVIARTSVMRYKATRAPVSEISRALGAQYILEGSVRRDSENVRVTVQLLRAADEARVWARQYDRKLTSVLALQGEIATQIADSIRSTMGEPPTRAASNQPAQTADGYAAYDLSLRGRYFWNKRTGPGFSQALDYFEQAAAKDPRYAPAHAGIADTYSMMSDWGLAPHHEAMASARAAALRAVRLDPRLAEAHSALAVIAEDYDYDWDTAEREFRRAIELKPNYATGHQWYALCLALQGHFTEAIAEAARARELDPLSPIVAADQAVIFHLARQYARAIDAFQSVIAVEPTLGRVHVIVQSYVEIGRFEAALEHIRRWRADDPGPWTWSAEAFVLGRAGKRAEAEDAIRRMEDEIRTTRMDPAPMRTFAYAGIRDKALVLSNLEASYAEHASFLTEIRTEPTYDFLREDSRFQELERRVHLLR